MPGSRPPHERKLAAIYKQYLASTSDGDLLSKAAADESVLPL